MNLRSVHSRCLYRPLVYTTLSQAAVVATTHDAKDERNLVSMQERSQEFATGNKRGSLGDGSPQRGPGAELRWGVGAETNANFQLRLRGTCTHVPSPPWLRHCLDLTLESLAIFVSGPTTWNSLSSELIDSHRLFRRHLKAHTCFDWHLMDSQ